MNKYIYICYAYCILKNQSMASAREQAQRGLGQKKSISSQLNKAKRGVSQAKAEKANFPAIRELAPNVGPALPYNPSLA